MRTSGDKMLDAPLARVGGKGLFIKELELALLDDRADIAVHSMKDVPVELPPELHLPIIMARADPRDALVSTCFAGLGELPPERRWARRACAAVVSLRRIARTCASRTCAAASTPDCGGSTTAISTLSSRGVRPGARRPRLAGDRTARGVHDAPRGGPGCARHRVPSRRHARGIADCAARVLAHYRVRALGAGFQPAARGRMPGPDSGLRVPRRRGHELRGLVASLDGATVLRSQVRGGAENAEALGGEAADAVLKQGAGAILASIYAMAAP